MTEKTNTKQAKSEHTKKEIISYSFAGIADTMSYQMFSFYIFNYYIAVKQLPVLWVVIGFMIWTLWNAINDPLLGALSDKSTSKWGRRKPFIVLGLVPLIALIILVWTPFGPDIAQYIYFLIIINLFDTFYTMYSLNQTSLFPEMFQNLKERARANNYVQIFNVIGLLLAAIIPTLFVPTAVEPGTEGGYIIGSVIMASLAAIFGFIFIKWGIKERVEYSKDALKAPSFKDSVTFTFNNRPFKTYVLTNLAVWYVFGLIPIMNPYYVRYILGVEGGMIPSIYLAILFISAIGFMVVWSKIFSKYGPRKGEILALSSLVLTLTPFLFMLHPIAAIFSYIIAGFGFAGIMFGRDIMMSTIIDSDELKVGVRREAAYYGVNALIIRLSTIGVYLSIMLVFWGIGWGVIYDPSIYTPQTNIGIFLLMYILPAIILILGLASLFRFPVTKEKYDEMQKDLDRIHEEKKSMVDMDKYEEMI
jgi:GPH family glycoside/pentoside/hexuronide:cation symporter